MGSPLRIVLFREGPCWLAQGLEHDVGVQGGDLGDLMVRLDLLLDREGPAVRDLPPAPKYFFDIWDRQAGSFLPARAFATTGLLFGLVA